MSWNLHVDYICAGANTRLHYLKSAGLMLTELLIGLCLSSDQFLNIMRLFGTMAFKASNRIDRGNSETSSSHRLFDYIVYALLGGTIIGRAPVSF